MKVLHDDVLQLSRAYISAQPKQRHVSGQQQRVTGGGCLNFPYNRMQQSTDKA